MTNNPEYLTPQEVAQRIRVKEGTLAQWRMRKIGIDYIKMEGKILYNKEDVEEYEKQNTIKVGK